MSSLRSNFSVVIDGDTYRVVDLDQGMSVTNDAENVIHHLIRWGGLESHHTVIYRDTDGQWDQLCHDGREFTGFRVLGARTPGEALAQLEACIECGNLLTNDEMERDRCSRCGHPWHDELEN